MSVEPPCRKLVIDLLAVFKCDHRLQESTYDKEIIKYVPKAECYYISGIQRKRYGEVLKRLAQEKLWGGPLVRLIREGKELNPSGRWREWAKEVWRGGFHKEEYVDLYAGVLSRFEDCSADCAILCTAEASVEQFETLLRELGDMFRGVKPGYEYISGNKILLRKPLR